MRGLKRGKKKTNSVDLLQTKETRSPQRTHNGQNTGEQPQQLGLTSSTHSQSSGKRQKNTLLFTPGEVNTSEEEVKPRCAEHFQTQRF